jgi:hypothetical protein
MQKKTGQEKNSYCPSGAEKGELFQGVLILSICTYISKKKSESRSKRKDKAARSLDEKEHHPAFEASRIFFINNKQDAR